MRCSVIICAILLFSSPALPKEPRPTPEWPNQFEIGRYTFLDCDPGGFYEIFIIRPTANGSSVKRIILTPARDKCLRPATLEYASASMHEFIPELLGSTNPCAIPEKALQRELTRRKPHLVFSFVNVVMQVQCGGQTRLLRSEILDKDMFDAAPNTPEHTSWTMHLLEHLDRAVGPGVMDKPIFPTLGAQGPPSKDLDSETLRDLSAGKYDALFQGEWFKLSELYRETQKRPPPPSARLLSCVPTAPVVFVSPEYPPLAIMAGVEGNVSFIAEINSDGTATHLAFQRGNPILCAAVKKAVSGWKFQPDNISYEVQATIEFALNCPNSTQ